MTIVFGTTLQPHDAPFAQLAAALAQRMGAALRLVHVSEDPRAPVVLGTDEEHILGSVRGALTREAERLHALTGADVRPHLAAGLVVDALVSVAELELASALIVGGSQARRHVLGTTAERVARQSRAPVWTLRESERLARWLRGEVPLRVLVGADLGLAARAARAFAARLKAVAPCHVEVAHVASPVEAHERLGLAPPIDEHSLAPEAEAAIARELERGAPPDESGAVLRILAARGSADAHLVGLADHERFDLIVVGQRRSSVLEQLWYGSVSRGTLRSAPVSVVCVPPTKPPATSFRAPTVVLVGTDLAETGQRAWSHALGFAAERGTVHLAHVLATSAGPDGVAARERAWHALSQHLDEGRARDRGLRVERHVLEGAAADQLLALARRVGADLIVLGVRSRSAAHRVMLGSVARVVSEQAPVPVLLVPAGDA